MSYPANFQADLLLPRLAKEPFPRPANGSHPTLLAASDKLAGDRGPFHRKRVWESDRDFNINLSRIATARELLRDSMLAYTHRMADSKRGRGLHVPAAAAGGTAVRTDAVDASTLLVRATHISRRAAAGRVGGASSPSASWRRTSGGGGGGGENALSTPVSGGGKSKSLPNIKLEPLLGNRERYKLSVSDSERLKDILGLRHIVDRRLQPVLLSVTAAEPASRGDRVGGGGGDADDVVLERTIKALAFQPATAAAAALPPIAPPVGAPGGAVPGGAAVAEAGERRRLDSKLLMKVNLEPPTGRADAEDEEVEEDDEDDGGEEQDVGTDSDAEAQSNGRARTRSPTATVAAAARSDRAGAEGGADKDYGTFAVVGADHPVPKSSGGRRTKRPKRMKIVAPNLSSIPEDVQEEVVDNDPFSTASARKHHTYRHIPLPHILDAIGETDGSYDEPSLVVAKSSDQSVEERKKDTAILRRVNAAADGPLQSRRKSMAFLAKRKLRKLPPLGGGGD